MDDVNNIEITGTLNFLFTFPKKGGNILSRDMANGYLDDDIIPAFPVDANAASAAKTTIISVIFAGSQRRVKSVNVATGVKSLKKSSFGIKITIKKVPNT